MDYIKRSLKIVNKELETDSNSFNHALDELKNRIKELTPLFNECIEKGINQDEAYKMAKETILNNYSLFKQKKKKKYQLWIILKGL